jgi:hypothetical protein
VEQPPADHNWSDTTGRSISRHPHGSSDNKNSDSESSPSAGAYDPAKPWLWEYNLHFNTTDEIAEGQSLVQWWGVSDVISLSQLMLILRV